jgi:hypothetical protein
MRWKLARLLVVIGAFLLVDDYYFSVHASYGSCTCQGVFYTSKYVLVNPICGTHGFYEQTTTLTAGDCDFWCEGTAIDLVHAYCGVDICDDDYPPNGGSYNGTATWDGDWWSQSWVSGIVTSCA